jgi:predicted O-methyltransferase YrrM
MMTVIRRLFARVCREARTTPLVNRVVDKVFQEYYQLPFPPTHYYSPLPDLPSVKRNLSRWYKQSDSPGIDWNLEGQFKLAEDLAAYAGETQLLPHFAQVTQDGYGQGHGEVEAHLLYMILRHFKPAQCIEVGSGVSTFYSLNALRANRERDGVNSNMTCIEPYPNSKLRELVTGHRVRLRECEVQDIELAAFGELSANDVLFIDSSHASKKDSDVEFLYLEVLPRLRNGVVIHIHDMPFPMPAIPLEHPLFDTYLFWNEAEAFLLFNSAFQVIQCQSQLHQVKPELLKKLLPIYDPKAHFPSSLWLSRGRPSAANTGV